VKDSDWALEQKRKASKNSLHLVAQILSNDATTALAIALEFLGRPLEHEHGKTVQYLATRKSRSWWVAEMASGRRQQHILQLVQSINSNELLVRMGVLPFAAQMGARRAFSKGELHDISSSCIELVRCMVSEEIAYQRVFCDWLPGKFFALTHADPDVVRNTLQYCERVFTAFTAAEKVAEADPQLRRLLESLLWTTSCWPREVLVGLFESSFEFVPADLLVELQEVAAGPASSISSENMFNFLRRQSRAHLSHRLGRTSMWHRSMCSQILEDADMGNMMITPEDELTQHHLPPSMFLAKHCDFSLGTEGFDALFSGRGWSSPSTQSYLHLPELHAALLHCAGNYDELNMYWLSNLAVPGSIITRRLDDGVEASGFVLSSGQYGVMVWRCRLFKIGDGMIAHLDDTAMPCWEQWYILKLEEWCARDIRPSTAAHVARDLDLQPGVEHRIGGGLVIACPDEPMSLLEFAAACAFKTLTVPFLRRLVDALEVVHASKPMLELDLVMLLVDHVLGPLTDDEMQVILSERGKRVVEKFGRTITTEHQSIVENLMPDDAEPIIEVVEKAEKLMAKAAAARCVPHPEPATASAEEGGGAPQAASSASSTGPPPMVRALVADREWTADEARALLPASPGCTISIHSSIRWQVRYPCKYHQPRSHSITWGTDLAFRGALLAVLRWVWVVHTAQTGEACPWLLDD
jgi:hypothetical protein